MAHTLPMNACPTEKAATHSNRLVLCQPCARSFTQQPVYLQCSLTEGFILF